MTLVKAFVAVITYYSIIPGIESFLYKKDIDIIPVISLHALLPDYYVSFNMLNPPSFISQKLHIH